MSSERCENGEDANDAKGAKTAKGRGANDESPTTDTLWPGVTVSSMLIPASWSSVPKYTPAAPEITAETRVWMSGPRKPPSVYGRTNACETSAAAALVAALARNTHL
eukprot:COSAG04_NODE_8788_length_931_cov_12.350962_2_plen_107_part_00